MIQHIWFNFTDTLCAINPKKLVEIRNKAYSEIVGRPISVELEEETGVLREKYGSHANLFYALGKSSSYWSDLVQNYKPEELYTLTQNNLPEILQQIKAKVPISLFSNIDPLKILDFYGISSNYFEHIIKAGMVKEPKPHLEGFYKLIEMTNLSAENILYIGDLLNKDILPAKKVGLKTGLMWDISTEADYNFKNFEEILTILL